VGDGCLNVRGGVGEKWHGGTDLKRA